MKRSPLQEARWCEERGRDCSLQAAALLARGGLSEHERAVVVCLLATALHMAAQSDLIGSAGDIAIEIVRAEKARREGIINAGS